MTADETGGWVFTDEYHAWQDAHRGSFGVFRHGTAWQAQSLGWQAGLYSIKTDDTTESASWPDPVDLDDLRV